MPMGQITTWKGAIAGRPDDAALVVVLLDGGGHDARHADAVAAHLHHLGLAVSSRKVAFMAFAYFVRSWKT
jgi:hypothetical protein